MRVIYLCFGFIFLGVGIIGIFLPLLPTTVFILLSAYCFSRSSEKFYNWLIDHPRFGQSIRDWQGSGSINKRAKKYAVGMIILSFIISLSLQVSTLVLGVQFVVLSAVSAFILTRPSN